jgi:large subunit ribosomal protein L3
MKFILAIKEKMTQIFDESGNVVPATLVNAGPITAVQIKTKEKDGYDAVQFGFGQRKEKNNFRYLREYRMALAGEVGLKVGDTIDADVFEKGDVINVAGISKGKGFQGVVKRHGFHGGPRTHGQKHSEREPGSIGATGPQRVFKGTRMPGRMGGDRITVKNLKIVQVDKKNNQLLIFGAVPGRKGTLLEIRGVNSNS